VTRRRKTRIFTAEQLEAQVAKIMAFAHPAPPPPAPPAARRQRRPSPWSADELADRSFVIARRWSRLSGTDVKICDAQRVARLRLSTPAILSILDSVWNRPRGLGACWDDLRAAEKALAVEEPAAAASV
jgi:hypothetical protein